MNKLKLKCDYSFLPQEEKNNRTSSPLKMIKELMPVTKENKIERSEIK
jgi:hypothetical protein